MLLTEKPATVLTHEQNIIWSISELRRALHSLPSTIEKPHKIVEAQGFYASDVISVQEIRSIDGGDRHIVRVLVPVGTSYYGSSEPVWTHVGIIA